jgi:hypothetical protein
VKPHHHGGGVLLKWRTNKNAERLDVRAALLATLVFCCSLTTE